MKTFKIANSSDPDCKQLLLSGAELSDWLYLQNKGFSAFRPSKTVYNTEGPMGINILLLACLTELGFKFQI